MTDGPFRNSELSAKWKRYGDELVSDAASVDERVRQASDSLINEMDMESFSPLFRQLNAHLSSAQLELDPTVEVEAVFDRHDPSPLTDNFQRHLIANLRDQEDQKLALDRALVASIKDHVAAAKNRLDEECIRARDLGDMSGEAYRKAMSRNLETFTAIEPSKLSEALVNSNKRAFAAPKKSGVDEGPDE